MIYSFETGIPQGITAEKSNVNISKTHKKDGEYGLLWEMEGDAVLSLKGEVGYHPFQPGGLNQDRDNFVVWLYREKPEEYPLAVEFYKQGQRCCSFLFGQAFTGWRTCWVPYEDMTGNPVEGMDEIRFIRKGKEADRIWIDQLITAVPIDPRHPVPDLQVPFVNLSVDTAVNAHWTSLLRFHRLEEEALAADRKERGKTVRDEALQCRIKQQVKLIGERMEQFILTHSNWPEKGKLLVSEDECRELCEKYDRFQLYQMEDGNWGGVTIDAACQKAAYPKAQAEELRFLTGSIEIKECCFLLLDTAYAWHEGTQEQKKKLADCYCHLLQHLWEQGWVEGSSLGTTHHLGYPMRALYPSVFLMRKPLKEAGLLEQASNMIGWFSGRGRVFRNPEELQGESVDTLNTLLQGILYSILLMEAPEDQGGCLKAMSRWLSTSLRPAPGLAGPFKIDGSAFHHANHYPAYAMGGFQGAAPVVYALSGTDFKLGEEAHRTMRNSLLYMRIYCNHYNWMISMSSRHPKGVGEMSQISSLEPFYYMALAGEPGGSVHDFEPEIDKEMAGALLRLSEYVPYSQADALKKLGYTAEQAPEGYFSMNYACAGIQRRENWMAGVRGHSRYLWGNETYARNNRYGRYITYGNLQILGSGAPVNNRASGYWQEGWDWNCFPGTTTVMLPVDELRQNVCVVDATAGFEEMLLSDETFAGGVSYHNRQGTYAMKLHGHAKYDGTLRARKSWFFFDDRIICLGSGIEDGRKNYDTITTLYQNYLGDYPEWRGNLTETEIGSVLKEEKILSDPSGNRYRIPAGMILEETCGKQESRAQDTEEVTFGEFDKLWINHGKAPQMASYEYMIRVQPKQEEPEELPYNVLCQKDGLHAVRDKESGICSLVFFDSGTVKELSGKDRIGNGIGAEWVLGADRECLLMVKSQGTEMDLSFCDPDLRFYEGQEEDQKNPDGTQKEVSLYSRKWLKSESIGKWTQITLDGHWEVGQISPSDEEKVKLESKETQTIVSFWGQDGLTVECRLVRK